MITIDGPAGVGKSTAAQRLARRLGIAYLDTGATYRALAYAALHPTPWRIRRRRICAAGAGPSGSARGWDHRERLNPVTDVQRLAALARRLPLRLRCAPAGSPRVSLGGLDITRQIRTEEISEAAAQLSQHPEVREAMVERQRALANRHGMVVEGRDTGSVVFPDAACKFFLDATPAIRARRRQRELKALYGTCPPLVQVREQLHFRDGLDRSRRIGPLITPPGAIVIDTSHLTASQVVGVMLRHINSRPRSTVHCLR
ncbi:MAG: d(CMP) kinase [Candidatus Omnitrophota bacterium]|nr:d(CMP) kinase [Candidatus Omnitrophota bacterium]